MALRTTRTSDYTCRATIGPSNAVAVRMGRRKREGIGANGRIHAADIRALVVTRRRAAA